MTVGPRFLPYGRLLLLRTFINLASLYFHIISKIQYVGEIDVKFNQVLQMVLIANESFNDDGRMSCFKLRRSFGEEIAFSLNSGVRGDVLKFC
ncbi:hypothetical protein ACE6H2_018389 [Prunus campanulata]